MELIASINASLAKKNGLDDMSSTQSTGSGDNDVSDSGGKKRKRKSRWGTEDISEKLFIPGMPTVLPANLSKEQEEAYLRKFLSSFISSL